MWINVCPHRDGVVWSTRMIHALAIFPIKNAQLSHTTTKNIIEVNPQDTEQTIQQIKQLTSGAIQIYDSTYNLKHKNNERIAVSDHINKTGHNPLIGNQDKILKPFIDISNLYNSKKGITTHCLGKHFNKNKEQFNYPSTYLCYISIIAKALGRKNIKGFLINTL